MTKMRQSKKVVSVIICMAMLIMIALPTEVNAATINYDVKLDVSGFTNSIAGYGQYTYSGFSQGSSVTLDVYMPNKSGSDWIQGTIYLVNVTDGTVQAKGIANFASTHQDLTWTNLSANKKYAFYYDFDCIGTSNKGYLSAYVEN